MHQPESMDSGFLSIPLICVCSCFVFSYVCRMPEEKAETDHFLFCIETDL